MSEQTFTEMEMDAIGEIMNISFGASATAVSTMLGTPTNITTPVVRLENREQLHFDDLKPAIGVEISYVEGLKGRNVMMFSREDVRTIVGMMMGMEIPQDQFVFDEMNKSAICEVMNQMMGASATALSEFLGYTVNISTPYVFEIDEEKFKQTYFEEGKSMVVCRFTMEVGDKLRSQFLNIMSVDLVKKLLEPYMESLGLSRENAAADAKTEKTAEAEPEPEPKKKRRTKKKDEPAEQEAAAKPAEQPVEQPKEQQAKADEEVSIPEAVHKGLSQSEADAILARLQKEQQEAAEKQEETPAPTQAAAAPVAPAPTPAAVPQTDPAMLQLLASMQQSQSQMMALLSKMQDDEEKREEERQRRREKAQEPGTFRSLSSPEYSDVEESGEELPENREMLMRVPLEISVEVGRTRKPVREILGLTQGSLVVLDKMAGEQADLFVNGERIARGDIVVVEDNFGIRITEILNKDIVKKLV
jgi:flagellar motor switch protein FliN/FliY